MIKEIKALTYNQTTGAIMAFLSVVSPGVLLIYLYNPELFASLETLKLILFSVSLSLPIVFLNIPVAEIANTDDNNIFEKLSLAFFLSIIIFYTAILIAYAFSLIFSDFLITLVITQALIATLFLIGNKHNANKGT